MRPRLRRKPDSSSSALIVSSILDAAEQVLAAHGLAGLTTNRVAERAGISIGSFYAYFPNKEAIAATLLERYLDAFTNVFVHAVETSGTVAEIAERVVIAMLETLLKQPQIHRYLFEMRSSADMHARIQENLDYATAKVADRLRRGGVSDERAPTIAFVLVHAADGIGTAAYQRSRGDLAEIGRCFVEMTRVFLERFGHENVLLDR